MRSIDITAQKEYTYSYEDGRIMCAVESDVEFDESGLITARNLVNTIHYLYDSDGNLTKKRIVSATGFASTQTVHYETPEDGNAIVRWNSGDVTVTSHSKTDSFGRKVFDELQIAKGFVSRRFSYHAGEPTEEHQNSDKLKSSATTQLVSQVALSDGRTLSYEYDAEERITKVTDSVEGITEYTYDALGQLLTEKHLAVGAEAFTDVNVMTYDGYGNIRSKNGVTYTYGHRSWKDRLSGVGTERIVYDAQGNPTTYLGHTLVWEKGRQLKTFDNNTYTYNANGIRTSKTVEGVKHTYVLDGAKILREEWDGNVMTVTYDNEDSVCGIVFNDSPFYFLKNLQGDVIAIINEYGDTVCRYTYDAWGKCTVIANEGVGIGDINPFRYRGYYFDREIGMYYLQSRYYDPEVGRFVNGDDTQYIVFDADSLVTNLFSYCNNTPVFTIDLWGTKLHKIKNLGFYDRGRKLFYYSINAPQRKFGYTDAFDHASKFLGFDLAWLTMYFTYDNKQWRIELWKGIYGKIYTYKVSTGCEIGVYYRKKYYLKGWYKCADNKNTLKMDVKLSASSVALFTRKSSEKDNYEGRHWWLTGFVPGKRCAPNTLRMHCSIWAKNKTMKEQMLKGLRSTSGSKGTGRTIIYITLDNEVRFDW